MLSLILILSLVGCIPSIHGGVRRARIVGGSSTEITDRKYQMVVFYSGRYRCGGVLFDRQLVLTTGWCASVQKQDRLKVGGGETSMDDFQELYPVSKVIVHEQMDKPTPGENDIAILVIEDGVTLNRKKLMPIGIVPQASSEGDAAVISGWGEDDDGSLPPGLKKASVTITRKDDCSKESTFCIVNGDGGPSRLDRGGPVTVDRRLAGLIGSKPASPKTLCTDVYYFQSWIFRHARENTSN